MQKSCNSQNIHRSKGQSAWQVSYVQYQMWNTGKSMLPELHTHGRMSSDEQVWGSDRRKWTNVQWCSGLCVKMSQYQWRFIHTHSVLIHSCVNKIKVFFLSVRERTMNCMFECIQQSACELSHRLTLTCRSITIWMKSYLYMWTTCGTFTAEFLDKSLYSANHNRTQ